MAVKSSIRFERRRAFIMAIALTSLLGCGRALAQVPKPVAKITGTMAGVDPGAGENLTIDVLRWSTNEEADRLLAAYREQGDEHWAAALQAAPSLGYVWVSGEGLGYTIRYARHLDTAAGERVIIAIDRALGSWHRPAWKALGSRSVAYPFSVIELRLDRRGAGVGKASLAANVGVDESTRCVALVDYASAPILITGVKRIERSSADGDRSSTAKGLPR